MTTGSEETSLFIKDIIIDCLDLEGQVTFWSALLERPVGARIGPYVWLERRAGVGLGFQRVQALGVGKRSVHLDLGSADPAAGQRRVERLGGRRLPGYEAGGFLVLADPEGNEFCIIPDGQFDLDEDGHAEYLQKP